MIRHHFPQLAIIATMVCLLSTEAQAQQVALPNIGARHLTFGMTAQPGWVQGERTNTTFEHALSHSQMIHVGVLQLINRQFAMSAGIDFGVQWLDEHGASSSGVANSELGYAFSVGLQGRWLPTNTLAGPMLGIGLEYFRAGLEEAPAQIMSINPSLGWLFWSKDSRMATVEIGYYFPLIQGLSLPTEFGSNEPKPVADWSWHRWSLSIRWSY